MDRSKALKSGIIIATLFVAIILTVQQQQVQAMNAGEAGYAQGKNDKQNGQEHNARCPDGITDAQCALYRAGYDAGWVATSIIRPDNEPNRCFNFDEANNNCGDNGDDGELLN